MQQYIVTYNNLLQCIMWRVIVICRYMVHNIKIYGNILFTIYANIEGSYSMYYICYNYAVYII